MQNAVSAGGTWIVVPAYNEERVTAGVLRELVGTGHHVVVDDGSTDATAEIAVHAADVTIRQRVNLGQRRAPAGRTRSRVPPSAALTDAPAGAPRARLRRRPELNGASRPLRSAGSWQPSFFFWEALLAVVPSRRSKLMWPLAHKNRSAAARNLQTTNLGVRSSNLFGRATSPIKIRTICLLMKCAMQNKIICMASAWPSDALPRSTKALGHRGLNVC
jgi:glycosyltransferase involved in cell wall biosynthesis